MDMDDAEFEQSYKGLKLTEEDREAIESLPRMKVGKTRLQDLVLPRPASAPSPSRSWS